jgi:putative tricarboxylic transport membrane protein
MRISAVCLAATAATAAVAAWKLGLWRAGAPGAGLFPLLAAFMLLGTSIGTLIRDTPKRTDREPADRRRLLLYLLAISLFAIAFNLLGAVLAILAFVMGVLRCIERLSWPRSMIVAGTLAGLCWIVFDQLLGVPLPAGLLGGG